MHPCRERFNIASQKDNFFMYVRPKQRGNRNGKEIKKNAKIIELYYGEEVKNFNDIPSMTPHTLKKWST